ncbi:hypothetical protein MUK42_07941 [Musa troglodytarum]|uniref:NAC domain-containing protein n=1 Tax=Musa troglodytarum TaxID=320322 RepID=A0A9E7ECZ9_9LILI|nr:hypothetical protein MUK42_07941 [Musa troglodytarum]
MEPVDLVPRGYRVAGAPLPARAVAFADVYGTEPWNLLGSERKPKSSGGSRVDRKAGTRSWTLNKKQEAVKSIVGGREMVVGRKSYLSFNDGRRKNSWWSLYEYEMISSGFQRRVLCHVKKNSHTVYSFTFTEAVSVTEAISGGSSIVDQKRNREESSTRSSEAPNLSKKPCRGSSVAHSSGALQSDVSPPPTAVVQQPVLASVVTPPESRLSSVVNGRWWK